MKSNLDIIQLARDLGHAIQHQDLFLEVQVAQQNVNENQQLQDAVNEFNLKKLSINNEASKDSVDNQKIDALNQDLKNLYDSIVNNDVMMALTSKKAQLDSIIRRVTAIILQSANGEDPDTTDYQQSACSGNCSSCSDCH